MKEALGNGFRDFSTYLRTKTAEAPTFEEYQKIFNAGFITLPQLKYAEKKGSIRHMDLRMYSNAVAKQLKSTILSLKEGLNHLRNIKWQPPLGSSRKARLIKQKEWGQGRMRNIVTQISLKVVSSIFPTAPEFPLFSCQSSRLSFLDLQSSFLDLQSSFLDLQSSFFDFLLLLKVH